MEHKTRPVAYNCLGGKQFEYICDNCSLHLLGHFNQHHMENVTGWTWVLTRENTGEEIASAGSEQVRAYRGTEEAALEDGLKRFNAEPCLKPN
jgi:hypothetical protein